MKKINLLVLILFGALCSPLSFAKSEGDREAINTCLDKWKTHPFKKGDALDFQIFSPSVKVIGLGGRELTDDAKTAEPKLMLIKPTVNVMAKSTFKLMNPNGWYCFKETVSVLGKLQIEVACDAHIETTSDSKVGVLGAVEQEGVAVLGSIRVKKIGCK